MITVSLAVEDKGLIDAVRASLGSQPVQIGCEQFQVGDLTIFLEKLPRSQPDVVLLDVSALREPVAAVVPKMRAAAPGAFLIALDTTGAAAATVLDCFRAGANEYLFPPISEGLRKALQSRLLEKARDVSASGGRKMVFLSAKGGCGATTLACHVAVALGCMNFRTLLADFDIDAGSVAFVMNCRPSYSIADALRNQHRLDASYWGALVSNGFPNLDVISAPTSLECKQRPEPDQIRSVSEFARARYRWTVADFGRGVNEITMAALKTADEACLVTTPDLPALHQCKIMVQTALDCGVPIERMHLIVNRVSRRDLHASEFQNLLGCAPYALLSDWSSSLNDAWVKGQLLAPRSEPGRQIARLTRKLAGIEEPKAGSRFSLFRQGNQSGVNR